MVEKLFSIVIPTYNRENTILRAVDSVINQKYQNTEIIVVDDGSRDNTKSVLSKYVTNGSITYYYQDNSGVQIARNIGLKMAKGDYILFLDSDDWLLPDCLLEMSKEFNKEICAVYCLTGIKKENGKVSLARKDYLEGYIYKEVLKQGFLTSTSFIAMKRDVLVEIGGWDINFPASQDDDICFRLAKYGKIKLINHILGIYGLDAGNGKQISSSKERVSMGWWKLWEKYKNDVIDECGEKIYLMHIRECIFRFSIIENIEYLKKGMRIIKMYSTPVEFACLKVLVVLFIHYGRFKRNHLNNLGGIK